MTPGVKIHHGPGLTDFVIFTAPSFHSIWIANAHRGEGKRFLVRADEKLTAFMELEAQFA
jgi:hypothetical protein